MLDYEAYTASVEYNDANEVLHGRLEFIRDLHHCAMFHARR